jgi:hypothetical protein
LAVLSCLQLEVYILVTAMALWIDVLCNTAIKYLSSHTTIYMGAFITTAIVSKLASDHQITQIVDGS